MPARHANLGRLASAMTTIIVSVHPTCGFHAQLVAEMIIVENQRRPLGVLRNAVQRMTIVRNAPR